MTWEDAQKHCEDNESGNLVSVHNDWNRWYLMAVAGHEHWVGLNDLVTEGVFSWTDGSANDYDFWRY